MSQQDKERSMKEAKLALKTGLSAYENDNYKLAEPLFIKALDKFEQFGEVSDPDFFQCLVSLADTLYHLRRYYEAKGYYERLSVGRLKNSESSDAQVVVALLKLAATHEKLEEVEHALTTFELTLELAESTIPKGHPLFNVIFDSYEILVERHIQDQEEKATKLDFLKGKRVEFGFTESMSGIYRALPQDVETQTAAEKLLAQPAEDIRKNLSAWTHTEISSWANEVRAQRARNTAQGLAALLPSEQLTAPEPTVDEIWAHKADNIAESEYERDKHKHVHLSAEMFKPRSAAPRVNELAEYEESQKQAPIRPEVEDGEKPHSKRSTIKKVDTDRRPLPIIPVLTTLLILGGAGGAIYFAREYAKNMVAQDTGAGIESAVDMTNKIYYSADRKRSARFVTRSSVELLDRGASSIASYGVKGEKSPSALTGMFGSGGEKLVLTEVEGGFVMPDGTMLFAEESEDQKVLNKMQAMANFATYFYAEKGHNYPKGKEDAVFGSNHFGWENPLTDKVNVPVVEVKRVSGDNFDETFTETLRQMRDMKGLFPADDAAKPQIGLIECMSLLPDDPNAADMVGTGFLIRAYGKDGKLIESSDPGKAFVIAQKRGVVVDVFKAAKLDDKNPNLFASGKPVTVELVMLPKK